MARTGRMLALAIMATAGGAALAASPPAPVVAADQVRPVAHPYDEAADGHAALAAALAEARLSGRKLLVDFGANWCPDCRILSGILGDRQVDAYVKAHYAVATIDVGRFNKNLDIAAGYGVKLHGIPTVLVVDPASGAVLNRDNPETLADAASMAPQAVVDQLVAWTRAGG